jgi:hypothetical protein
MAETEPTPALTMSPAHIDDRGTLITTEFADVPFPVVRVFTVHAPRGGARRGDHAVNGAQLLILLSGTVSVQNGPDADNLANPIVLDRVGSRLLLADGSYIRYSMTDEDASILVLCERPFEARV